MARHVNERRSSQWDGCDVWLLKQYQHHPPWKVRFIFPWFARRKTFLQEMYGTLTPFCFPCTTWLICSLYLLVFWCGAIHSSLLTTALYSAGFNWVTRCFTSFLVEAENPSGSPTPLPPSAPSEVRVNERTPLSPPLFATLCALCWAAKDKSNQIW